MNAPRLFIIYLFITAFTFISCRPQTDKDQPSLQLKALNSMERELSVQQAEGKPYVEIKLARNEYEAFQVVITADKSHHFKNIKIEMTGFSGESGAIGMKNITMFREGLVHVRNSSPRAAFLPGLYPDPLIPFINPVTGDSLRPLHRVRTGNTIAYEGAKYSAYPIDLLPGEHCIIWVDVFAPPDAAPGNYTGEFRVRSGDILSSIPMKLKVWNFTLPDTASHRTHMGHFGRIAEIWDIESTSEKYREIEMRFCRELAACRVNPPIPHHLLPEINDDGSIKIIPERHEALKKYIEEVHLLDFEIPRAPFMKSTSNSPRPTPASQTDPVAIEKTERYYRQMYEYVKENGWEKRAYLYLLDEPNSVKDYNQVINLAKVAEAGAPELQRLVVEQTYKHDPSWPDLDNYIDIWCALFGFIDRNTVQEKINQGDEVWSYTALVQPAPDYHPEYEKLKDKNPPYWHIDQPLMSYRIPTWINRQYDITGLLYWTTVGWYTEDPWLSPVMGPIGTYPEDFSPEKIHPSFYNGGGLLFYPGNDAGFDGPVTSIRLKNLREGLEDYEYFAILDRHGEAAFVKQTIDEICPEWWDIKMDDRKLLELRERLAGKIETLEK